MAFNNENELKCKIGKLNEIFDERGNTALFLREAAWYKDGGEKEAEMHLELRKVYITADGQERPNKGFRFCTEDGPHRLVNCLMENGYGHTQECIRILSKRKDFEESLNNVIGEVAVKKAKKSQPRTQYFDPRELINNG